MVDSSSIEVSRRARQAKTDRMDAERLLNLLQRRRVLGADAALAAKMVDGIATFDDVLAKMQKSAVPQKPPGASRLGRARAALALI